MKRLDAGVCPVDFYSKAEIARYEGIPAEKMARLARDTLEVLEKLCPVYGFTDLEAFAPYYNSWKNGLIFDKQANYFYWHSRLQPFAHLMQLFVRRRKAQGSSNVHIYADFGIRRNYYDEYKASGKLPQVLHRGRLPKHGLTSTRDKRAKVAFDGGGRVDVPLNDTYRRFKEGIATCNAVSTSKVTMPEMVLAAIDEYMENRPTLFKREPDAGLPVEVVERYNANLFVTGLDPELVNRMYGFLQRHNAAGGRAVTMSEFVGAAIRGHLDRMPLD